jgi:hypothetical protein
MGGSIRGTVVPLLAAAAVLAIVASGCGPVDAKQVRIESSAVSSTATESATVASEFGRGRLNATFARQQLKVLAKTASAPAVALGASPAPPPVSQLAADTQALALESQRRINDLTERLDDGVRRKLDTARLTSIAAEASAISDRAESVE